MAHTQKDVTALLNLINSSANKLIATHNHVDQPFVSPTGVTPSPSDALIFHDDIDVAVLAAACDQLKATFVNPAQELLSLSFAHLLPATLGIAIEAHVAEGLRQAPAEGIHIDVLAQPSGFDPQILARCLRLLADHHVFREVSPNNFAHTRLSLPLDTGKSIETIVRNHPEQLYAGTDGVVAALDVIGNHSMRVSACLLDWVRNHHGKDQSAGTDGSTGNRDWIARTAFQLGFGTQGTYFEWLRNNPVQQAVFQAAMTGLASIQSSKGHNSSAVHDFPWKGLADGDVVVDVGGGAGSAFLPLIKVYPHLRFIVQDLPDVEPQFNTLWEGSNLHHIQSGQIKFQAHDFFCKNPVLEAAVYHLRLITHDWPDSEAVKILKCIAEAAGPASYIMITDFVAPVGTSTTSSGNSPSPFSEHAEIPSITPLPTPLITPTAQHGGDVHQFDLQMLGFLAAGERTADHWRRLLDEVGLRIVHVVPGHFSSASGPGTLVCVKKASETAANHPTE